MLLLTTAWQWQELHVSWFDCLEEVIHPQQSASLSVCPLRPTFGAGAQLTFWASIPSIHTKLASNNALATSGKNYWWVHWWGLTDVTSKCVKQYASKPNWNFHTLVDLKQSLHVLPHFLHLSFETFKLTIRVCGTQLLRLELLRKSPSLSEESDMVKIFRWCLRSWLRTELLMAYIFLLPTFQNFSPACVERLELELFTALTCITWVAHGTPRLPCEAGGDTT